MELTNWIRTQAATAQPLNIHAVARERPDLLEIAFGGPNPRGWRRSLLDAGVDPYKIALEYEEEVECAICGLSFRSSGAHLKKCHGMTGEEYHQEFGPGHPLSSEANRAARVNVRPIAGIAHWERLWSRHYVIDWILLLHQDGHPLNLSHVGEIGPTLATHGMKRFGSWDAALGAAGLDAALFRAVPPGQQWTRPMVVESLRGYVKLRKQDRRLQMPIPLRMAVRHHFGSTQAACRALGLNHEDINPRAVFKGEAVAKLVAAIRALEPLKGQERRRRLNDILFTNDLNQRIVKNHYLSLLRLVAEEGIDPHAVAPEIYRDEADVQHDLDLLEREGKPLNFGTLIHGHGRLYKTIRETGWGAERVESRPLPVIFPPLNRRMELLRNRMIDLRRKHHMSMATAASKAGISGECWDGIETKQVKTKETSIAKIERLLEEYQIPISTMPHTPVE